ncbi:hypothetical protein GpartN1_g7280.t1 [Galdieria partita]|uniref:Adaptor protein ClpS core domain-containing protein n=1 Tax=Galdieria partita TaxID=83374 RepID=A0A9C7UTM8_9RHOD|nr:hypothetical protein GpartN1_g7280.t1 [Galdieria partita]
MNTQRQAFLVPVCTKPSLFLKTYKKLYHFSVYRRKCCYSCSSASKSPRETFCAQVYATGRRAGGAQLLEKKKQKRVKSESKTQGDPGKPYKVLLFNDETHTKQYVLETLLRVIPGMTQDQAVGIVETAHTTGSAVVGVWIFELAEAYCDGLRSNGLGSDIEPDT